MTTDGFITLVPYRHLYLHLDTGSRVPDKRLNQPTLFASKTNCCNDNTTKPPSIFNPRFQRPIYTLQNVTYFVKDSLA